MKWYTHFLQISFIYLNLNLFLHFGAAEDVEDPIGKGRKVYKGKYPNTCISPHPPSPSAYIYMYPLLLYCDVFRTLRLEHYLNTGRAVRLRIAI